MPPSDVASKSLAKLPVRLINILYNKTTVRDGTFATTRQLYFYVSRYLIERVSWLCRDMRPRVPEGDGRVKIIFSRRGKMSYKDFQEYMLLLKSSDDEDISIHWPVIDIDSICALDHSSRAGLQLVDIAASSFAAGVEADLYGNYEPRYAENLKPVVYERRQNYMSYGCKIVPKAQEMQLSEDQMKLINIYK